MQTGCSWYSPIRILVINIQPLCGAQELVFRSLDLGQQLLCRRHVAVLRCLHQVQLSPHVRTVSVCVLFPGPNLTPWPLPLRYIALTECRPGSQTLTHKHTHTLETVARELLETSKSETPVNCSHTAVYTLCPPAPTPACRRCTGTSRWDLPLCHSAFWIQRFNPCPADVPPTQPVSRSQPGEWRDTNTAIS